MTHIHIGHILSAVFAAVSIVSLILANSNLRKATCKNNMSRDALYAALTINSLLLVFSVVTVFMAAEKPWMTWLTFALGVASAIAVGVALGGVHDCTSSSTGKIRGFLAASLISSIVAGGAALIHPHHPHDTPTSTSGSASGSSPTSLLAH